MKKIGLQQRPWITPDISSAIYERNTVIKNVLNENPTLRHCELQNTNNLKQHEIR